MTHRVAILSAMPTLSHHVRKALPNLTIFDVSPDKKDALKELNTADIVVADCDLLLPHAHDLTAKWVQTTWAGVELIISKLQDKKVNYTITRFSDKNFAYAMSEYVISHIYNFERDQRQQYENQRKSVWSIDGKIKNHRFICDLNVGILGLGNIGKSIARNLKGLGAVVWGVTRSPLKEKLDYIDEHRTIEFLPEVLKNSDYVVNVLPSTPNTIGLLNGNALQNCQERGSVFINIGRGAIIKEIDLLNALEKKWISGAILDVFEKEPLLKENKLWNMTQVTISPHIAGVSRVQDIAKFFAENYRKFNKGEGMLNVINWQAGY